MQRGQVIVGLAAGVVAGAIGAWAGLGDRSESRETVVAEKSAPVGLADDTAEQLEQLRTRLDEESALRAALAAQVDHLTAELASIRPVPPVAAPPPTPALPDDAEHERLERFRPTLSDGRVDPDVLLAAGFPRAKVDAIREQLDAVDLEQLYLRDRAAREGWLGTQRFIQESQNLPNGFDQVRNEWGEETYDWVLFSSGHPNRVVVDDVMDGSAAADAGLRSGDLVMRYDDSRLYKPRQLRDATVAGRAGETVALEVQRGDEVLRVFLPRGPLGVRIRADVVEPASAHLMPAASHAGYCAEARSKSKLQTKR